MRTWPFQASEKPSFHGSEQGAQGGAVNPRSAAQPEGAEASTARVLGYAPRRAAQAGLTGGADRSSRLRSETKVERGEKAGPAVRLHLRTGRLFSGPAGTGSRPATRQSSKRSVPGGASRPIFALETPCETTPQEPRETRVKAGRYYDRTKDFHRRWRWRWQFLKRREKDARESRFNAYAWRTGFVPTKNAATDKYIPRRTCESTF